MESRLKPIKKIFFGGSNSYYIDKDRNYFIKVNKGKREWIIKEYQYLKKYWDKIEKDELKSKIDYLETEINNYAKLLVNSKKRNKKNI